MSSDSRRTHTAKATAAVIPERKRSTEVLPARNESRLPSPPNVLHQRMTPEETPPIWETIGEAVEWRIVALSLAAGLLIVGVTIAAIHARNQKHARAAAAQSAVVPALEEQAPVAAAPASVEEPVPEVTPAPVVEVKEEKPAPVAQARVEPGKAKPSNAFGLSSGLIGHRVGSKSKAAPELAAETEKPKPIVKRRYTYEPEELRRQLILTPEVKQHHIPLESRKLLAAAPKTKRYSPDEMPDFGGLPMRMGVDCQLGKEAADNLQALSRKMRGFLANAGERTRTPDPRGPNADTLRGMLALLPDTGASPLTTAARLADLADHNNNEWLQPEAIPTLTQMLTAEAKPIRLLLIELLAHIKGREASVALAQRAMFDLSPEVREAAIQALSDRPAEEYRDKLLEGFRYPWAAAADHAAEALAALKDRDAVVSLVSLLDEPDPRVPFKISSERNPVIREVVQINHLANCAMCHASSVATTDPVRGQIPSPSQPLPPPVQYYDNGNGIFVRADVTYLRQDFSVPQPVSSPGPWPTSQRFDYMVRTRPLTSNELTAYRFSRGLADQSLRDLTRRDEPRYEQRDAVLFALRELTGLDLGVSTSKWWQYVIEEGLVKR